ncbi:MAG TPA: YggT family protein [Acetobacteraceae bacterium]|nr:YggT family protein [Acetobacteraceae bacterium]
MISVLFQIIQIVLHYYLWAVIIAAVLSTLISFGVLDSRNRFVWAVADFFYRITEPALRPIRRILPNFGGVDLSPMALIVVIWVLQAMIGHIQAAIMFGSVQPLFY